MIKLLLWYLQEKLYFEYLAHYIFARNFRNLLVMLLLIYKSFAFDSFIIIIQEPAKPWQKYPLVLH